MRIGTISIYTRKPRPNIFDQFSVISEKKTVGMLLSICRYAALKHKWPYDQLFVGRTFDRDFEYQYLSWALSRKAVGCLVNPIVKSIMYVTMSIFFLQTATLCIQPKEDIETVINPESTLYKHLEQNVLQILISKHPHQQ